MSDNLDQFIHDAFVEFDAVERGSNPPVPGVADVRRTVSRRRRIRYTAIGAVSALLIAAPVVAFAANSPQDHVGSVSPTGPGPTDLPSPTNTIDPSAQVSPSGQASPSGATPSSTRAKPTDVRNARLTLPAFPGAAQACPAGPRTFVNGTAALPNNASLVVGEMQPIMADLDGVPGDEELTTVRCQDDQSTNATQLLALSIGTDGTLTPLGYVVNSPDTPLLWATFDHDTVKVDNAVVHVTAYGAYQTNGWPPCDRQVRGYAYRNGTFSQVDGPTKFTAPSKDLHKVDFRNVGLLVGLDNPDHGGAQLYCVPMTNGTGQATIYPDNDPSKGSVRSTFTIGTVSFVSTAQGDVPFAILSYRSSGGAPVQTLQTFENADSAYPLGFEVLRSGLDGVAGIEKAEVNGDQVIVTVSAASGNQVRVYKPSPQSNERWQRVS